MDEVPVPVPLSDTDSDTLVFLEEVPADAPLTAMDTPPVQELGAVWTVIALFIGIGLTRGLTLLGEKKIMFGLFFKPLIPWTAFIIALFARTAIGFFVEQEFSLSLLNEAILAGAGAVSSHAGVRSLSKHVPPLVDAFVAMSGKR